MRDLQKECGIFVQESRHRVELISSEKKMRHSVLFLMLNFSAHFTDKKQKSTKFKGNFVVFFSAPTSYNSDQRIDKATVSGPGP